MTAEGISLIIAAVGIAGAQLITALRTNRAVKATKALTEVSVRDGKEVLKLVNGPYSEALRENAELRAFKAYTTGSPVDEAVADRARAQSDAHTAHSAQVAKSTDAHTAAIEAAVAAKVEIPPKP